jgi:hypothetical protein
VKSFLLTAFCASLICFSRSFFFWTGPEESFGPDVAAVATFELSDAATSSLDFCNCASSGTSFVSISGLPLRSSGLNPSNGALVRIQRIWPEFLSMHIRSHGSTVR